MVWKKKGRGHDIVVHAHIKGTRQEQELRGHDIIADAHFEGTRQGREQRGRDIIMGTNYEGARNQVQVQDDGKGHDAQRQFRAMPL